MTTMSKHKKKIGKSISDFAADEKEARRAALAAARGALAWVDYSVDDFLREKREEVDRENAE